MYESHQVCKNFCTTMRNEVGLRTRLRARLLAAPLALLLLLHLLDDVVGVRKVSSHDADRRRREVRSPLDRDRGRGGNALFPGEVAQERHERDDDEDKIELSCRDLAEDNLQEHIPPTSADPHH